MHTLLNIHPLVTDSLYGKDITSCPLYVQIAKLPDWLYIYILDRAQSTTPSQPTHTLYITLTLLYITPLRAIRMTPV